jgi:ATP-dependent Zn protease
LNKNLLKSIGIWIAIGIIMMTIFNQFSSSSRLENKLVYSQFMDQVKSGNIEKVRIDGQNITGTTNNGKKFSTFAPTDPWLVSDLLKNGVVVEAQPAEKQSFLGKHIHILVPNDTVDWCMDFLHETNAGWRKRWRSILLSAKVKQGNWIRLQTKLPLKMLLVVMKLRKRSLKWSTS